MGDDQTLFYAYQVIYATLAMFGMWLKNLNNSKLTLTYENKFY